MKDDQASGFLSRVMDEKRPFWRCLMVSNDANYLKMTEITGGGQPTNQTDSTPTALVVGRLVGVEEKDSVFPSIRLLEL